MTGWGQSGAGEFHMMENFYMECMDAAMRATCVLSATTTSRSLKALNIQIHSFDQTPLCFVLKFDWWLRNVISDVLMTYRHCPVTISFTFADTSIR